MIDEKTYVFGHQNPDTDSICSAISYANLKNQLGEDEIAAGRLGDVSDETKFALDFFEVEPPKFLTNVKPQVADLHYDKLLTVKENDSVLQALSIIVDAPGRSLPVVDDKGKLVGIISLPDLINAFTTPEVGSLLKESKTPYSNIKEIFKGKIETGEMPEYVTGEVYAGAQLIAGEKLNKEDLVVVSSTAAGLLYSFQSGAENIILCNIQKDMSDVIPRGYQGFTMTTDYTPFEAMRLITQAIPVSQYVHKESIEFFRDSDILEDVREAMEDSPHHRFPVVNDDNVVLTMISGSNLIDHDKKKVILVDHNERSQSIQGIEDADVVEVVDHHRINEITTTSPLYMRMEPVGCTSTIITEMYEEQGQEIPAPIAGLMLSAILSDTLLFNSPTCTARDIRAAEKLAEIAGVDALEYGSEMINAGSNIEGNSAQKLLGIDRKKFNMGDKKVTIAQINASQEKAEDRIPELLEEMEIYNNQEGSDLFTLIITDLAEKGSNLYFVGDDDLVEAAKEAFQIPEDEVTRFIPNLFSRKKQVVPQLSKIIGS